MKIRLYHTVWLDEATEFMLSTIFGVQVWRGAFVFIVLGLLKRSKMD